jgi:ubiquitin-protein ligase
MSSAYRLQKELRSLWEDPLPCVHVHPTGALSHWNVTIKGPKDSPYEGGAFRMDLIFPKEYPFKAPICSFRTPIYHCNLSTFVAPNQQSVESLLCGPQGWRPGFFVRDVLMKILAVMVEPVLPLSAQVDRAAYDATAREWTRRYSLDPDLGPVITAHMDPTQPGVSCYGMSGKEVCAVKGEALASCKVAGLRLSLAARLDVPPQAVRLVLASGRCLHPDEDVLSLTDAFLGGATAVAAS